MKLSTQVCDQLFPDQLVEKINHLATGRMGSVYKVTLKSGENLCVKILTKDHPTKLQDSSGWKLAYEHLNFDFKCYEDNKYFYFTTPYFKGKLFHYTNQYSLKSRFQIIQSLIKAIIDIHNKGLIHRDLKCDNIIIDKDEAYIIDFGRSVNILDSSNGKASGYIFELQLPKQGTIPSNIRRIFQPYTAPEYFKKHYYNGSTIGFRSDYYSIAQLFRFLIPEYSYLADEVLYTEGLDRNTAFGNFSKKIDETLKENCFNQKFNEAHNPYYKEFQVLYRKLIFFIRQIFDRLFNLAFQFTFSKTIKRVQPGTRCNSYHNTPTNLFKLDKQKFLDNNFASSLPRNAMLYR